MVRQILPRGCLHLSRVRFRSGSRDTKHPDSRGWLQRCLDEEVAQRRLFPWTAVAFGLGILLCFAAEGRPHPAAPVFGLGVCALTGWLGRHDHRICRVVIGLAMVLAGFTAALVRFERVDAPILTDTLITQLVGDDRECRGAYRRCSPRHSGG